MSLLGDKDDISRSGLPAGMTISPMSFESVAERMTTACGFWDCASPGKLRLHSTAKSATRPRKSIPSAATVRRAAARGKIAAGVSLLSLSQSVNGVEVRNARLDDGSAARNIMDNLAFSDRK